MAQFIVKPPLDVVGTLFSAATSRTFVVGVSWVEFTTIPVDLLESMRMYIRPCHQSVLNRTLIDGNPLTFLRQLLRPHGLRIETLSKGWRLIDPLNPCVTYAKGSTITWE